MKVKECVGLYLEDRFSQFVNEDIGGTPRLGANIFKSFFGPTERDHHREKSLSKYAKWEKFKWKFDEENANCPCKQIFEKILEIATFAKHRIQNLSWKNSESVGKIHYWDVAKVFMLQCDDITKKSTGAAEVDLPILCNIMSSCDLFVNIIRKQNNTNTAEEVCSFPDECLAV